MRKRILIIEDDRVMRCDMAQVFAEWGYDVNVCSNGLTGFRAIGEWSPDLVVSDIQMPVVTGFDLMAHIRKLKSKNPELAFGFVSALPVTRLAKVVEEAGADFYHTKPVDYPQLKLTIGNVLEQAARRVSFRGWWP